MKWLARLFSGGRTPAVDLPPALAEAWANWRALPESRLDEPHLRSRYIVVDVEASGLNLKTDRLISIGAVAVNDGVLDPHDAFEVILRQDQVSGEANILLHGIGGSAQRDGVEPAEALVRFLDYIGKAPLVAYHALFDQSMIAAAMKTHLGVEFTPVWIDLAWVMPELFPECFEGEVQLDDWLTLYGIEVVQRHNAVADAWATAMLLQVAIARGRTTGAESPQSFIEKERVRRWRRRM